jgi:hypothetical protein
MKADYNSKQKKIYEEYSLYSTEMLNQMISERKIFKSGIIRIIKDILVERSGGFYTAKADKLVDQFQISEEEYDVAPEPENEEGVKYEEVPWLNKNPAYFPGISGNQCVDVKVVEEEYVGFEGNETEPEDEDKEESFIKEDQVKYWKCPKCGESVAMVYDVCWNCQSEMPADIVHSEVEEIKREIEKNSPPPKLLSSGISLIIFSIIILVVDVYKNLHYDYVFRYLFGAFFGLTGLAMVVAHFVRKNK